MSTEQSARNRASRRYASIAKNLEKEAQRIREIEGELTYSFASLSAKAGIRLDDAIATVNALSKAIKS